jgi:hypothetical protein
MRASSMTLVGAATVLAASLTGASAQVLNLTGQFQCVRLCFAAPPAFAYLTQADWELNLVNEAGVPSRGWIDYPGHIWAAAWNEGAFYSPDGMTIQFDNGSVWQRVIEVPVLAPAPLSALSSDCVERLIVGWAIVWLGHTRNAKNPDCARRHNPDFRFATVGFLTVRPLLRRSSWPPFAPPRSSAARPSERPS